MNFRNLQYFYVTAKELNFTKAADQLHIVQQSLSYHISKLEEEFGQPLFDRNIPMALTPAGVRVRRKTPFLVHLKRPILGQLKRPIPQLSFL